MSFKLLLLTILSFAPLMPISLENREKSELFVLATLYRRHENTSVYDTAKLRQIIQTIKPDVMVLDVTPKELREEKVHQSKIEYMDVVFPLIRNGSYKVYPAEPDEPMFSEIVHSVIQSMNSFKAAKPEISAALDRIDDETFEALKIYWKTPADLNSDFTDKVIQGRKMLEMRLNGTEEGNRKWNQHSVQVTLRAIKENPGKRVLLLAGIDNCGEIREILKGNKEINLIDMEKWLHDNVKSK